VATRRSMARLAIAGLLLSAIAGLVLIRRKANSSPTPAEVYGLRGGETIAIRSLASNQYLELQPSGRVIAGAKSSDSLAARWRVLVLDANTVAALLRSAHHIDQRSTAFTGRRMVSASSCPCSGFSNAHGMGRFCHPWEDPMQEAWCYVLDNCSSANSRGSFGRRYESCDAPPQSSGDEEEAYLRMQSQTMGEGGEGPAREHLASLDVKLSPASGCNCSGYQSPLGYGASCRGWEYEGQTPWCYVDRGCALASGGAAASRWARKDNGSFGQPFETCVWRSPSDPLPSAGLEPPARRRLQQTRLTSSRANQPPQLQPPRRWTEAEHRRAAARRAVPSPGREPPPGRRLQAPGRISQLLASKPEAERYIVLVSALSHTFLTVEAPPHKEALLLSARSDALSMRSIFSSFERTKLILALATNSLLNLCDEDSGEVCTGTRGKSGDVLKLLRSARRTARWQVEVVT
jgi:hypothetical protein